MAQIELTQGKYAQVDDADYEWLNQWNWSVWHGQYAQRRENGKLIFMHRQIMGFPKFKEIDHINQDGLDNQRSNLRIATRAQNERNKPKPRVLATSSYKGVFWNKQSKKWQGNIKVDGKNHYLGSFSEERHAAMVYDMAAHDIFGEFANLNFKTAIHG